MWDIAPLIGLGPLKFGMSQQDVAAIPGLGALEAADPAFDGSLMEYRGLADPICNYVEGRLAGADTSRRVPGVRFEGTDVYTLEGRTLLALLERRNGGAKIGLGSILFVNLSINTTGFYDPETRAFFDPTRTDLEDTRGLGVFVAGAFDRYLTDYADISFLG